MPPALLEEVFALNEELDEIRELRAAGAPAGAAGRRGSSGARSRSKQQRAEHERELQALSTQWDALVDGGADEAERRAVLDALRERMLERNYINNLLAGIEREAGDVGSGSRLRAPKQTPNAESPEP